MMVLMMITMKMMSDVSHSYLSPYLKIGDYDTITMMTISQSVYSEIAIVLLCFIRSLNAKSINCSLDT